MPFPLHRASGPAYHCIYWCHKRVLASRHEFSGHHYVIRVMEMNIIILEGHANGKKR